MIFLQELADFQSKIEVVGCFLEYGDQILLLHRQDHCSQGNLWGIPRGKLERGRNSITSAIREINEETGFDVLKEEITYLGKVFINIPCLIISITW